MRCVLFVHVLCVGVGDREICGAWILCSEENVLEHGSEFAVLTDCEKDEDFAVIVEDLDDLLTGKVATGVSVAAPIARELISLLHYNVPEYIGLVVALESSRASIALGEVSVSSDMVMMTLE